MATKISCPSLHDVPVLNMHHLPCTIKSNGKANVSTYFKPVQEEKNGKMRLSATFRGRPLDGEKLSVPNGCIGIVTLEKQQPFSEDEARNIEVCGKFEEFTKWHFDSKYTSDSTLDRALQHFPTISDAVVGYGLKSIIGKVCCSCIQIHAPVTSNSAKGV